MRDGMLREGENTSHLTVRQPSYCNSGRAGMQTQQKQLGGARRKCTRINNNAVQAIKAKQQPAGVVSEGCISRGAKLGDAVLVRRLNRSHSTIAL